MVIYNIPTLILYKLGLDSPPHPQHLKTEQSTPLLSERIDDKSTKKQPYRNSNRHLNHAVSDVEDHCIDIHILY